MPSPPAGGRCWGRKGPAWSCWTPFTLGVWPIQPPGPGAGREPLGTEQALPPALSGHCHRWCFSDIISHAELSAHSSSPHPTAVLSWGLAVRQLPGCTSLRSLPQTSLTCPGYGCGVCGKNRAASRSPASSYPGTRRWTRATRVSMRVAGNRRLLCEHRPGTQSEVAEAAQTPALLCPAGRGRQCLTRTCRPGRTDGTGHCHPQPPSGLCM